MGARGQQGRWRRASVGVVDELGLEGAPLVLQGDETRGGVGGEMRDHPCFVLSEEVVSQDEEVSAFHDLEAVRVRASFDGEDDGDRPKHEQALTSRANHRAHAWRTGPVSDDGVGR